MIASLEAECVCRSYDELGESPVWNDRDDALYRVDCVQRMLIRDDLAGRTERWSLRDLPGSLCFREDGNLLIAYRNGLGFFDIANGTATPIAVEGVDFDRERFNDGKCDRRGRFWVGTLDRKVTAPVGALYTISSDLKPRRIETGFTLSNGIAWTLDDQLMYHCDSVPRHVFVYDFDVEPPAITNRRVFLGPTEFTGQPDGCAVDTEGCLWLAEFGAGRVARYEPDGRLDKIVRLPVSRVTSVAFGGIGLTTLYITSARYGLSEAELQLEPLAGSVFAVAAGVAGVPQYRFSG